ncbi:MAG: hypothetical protein UW13_C0003G0116 [candidate division WWE3 bacterium GW2011_GWA1_43_94]|nr:hypothetical protein P147_WWE3C00001G0535 [candidate division WWE3 bacterium RAAC2_WWE3_1]KKS29020.1 MAG: hypothetical protein UU91_C0010G0015 [candidate division WWE3 bacterium GW2011_GWB1_42_117]KKS55102.1 MAG: hypothetical protein UV21_C0003G0116 [candidate division WWE3 bacterium GW2011_GWD2_42_34]KKT10262.1 MAG: hypothetical protein UV90_C0007G0027 [candidate division WWE3 bacterium GW2011_GWA2_43_24]KKT27529.1 MAG: hypothetical protein UW13_C0003G0116 [candidate division WWE3 bacterium
MNSKGGDPSIGSVSGTKVSARNYPRGMALWQVSLSDAIEVDNCLGCPSWRNCDRCKNNLPQKHSIKDLKDTVDRCMYR